MPTMNIIGYLWSRRQHLELDGISDVLEMVADLQRLGLDCVRAHDIEILGIPRPDIPAIQLVEREPHDWALLVEDAIIHSTVEDTIHMLHEDGDSA